MARKRIACLAALALMPTAVLAQQRTYFDSSGRVSARETGSNGSTTLYDANGRAAARTSTDSQGVTTIYGSDGRKAGTVTKPVSQAR